MIMKRGQPLLLPVAPGFIWLSLLLSLVLDMLVRMKWPELAWLPGACAMCLLFWNMHQPDRVGVGTAFFLGLLMDLHQGTLMGAQALAWTLTAYLAASVYRRLLWFKLPTQSIQVTPLFLAGHAALALVRLLSGDGLPPQDYWFAPLLQAALWPLISWLLLLPQRRPPDSDVHRPL